MNADRLKAERKRRLLAGPAAVQLTVADAYHRGSWRGRKARRLGSLFALEPSP